MDWKPEWWKTRPIGYWTVKENQKKFLDEIKMRFQIKSPSDWGKLKIKDIRNAGGNSILKHYKGSLYRCVQFVYPGML